MVDSEGGSAVAAPDDRPDSGSGTVGVRDRTNETIAEAGMTPGHRVITTPRSTFWSLYWLFITPNRRNARALPMRAGPGNSNLLLGVIKHKYSSSMSVAGVSPASSIVAVGRRC